MGWGVKRGGKSLGFSQSWKLTNIGWQTIDVEQSTKVLFFGPVPSLEHWAGVYISVLKFHHADVRGKGQGDSTILTSGYWDMTSLLHGTMWWMSHSLWSLLAKNLDGSLAKPLDLHTFWEITEGEAHWMPPREWECNQPNPTCAILQDKWPGFSNK